jgi:hypothetical protein
MKTWVVTATVTGSKYLGTINAETKREARIIGEALHSNYISLCHQCSDQCEDATVTEVFVEEQ